MQIPSPELGVILSLYLHKSCVLISLLPPPIHTTARQAQPIKRPIQIGPKISIQPKPLITAVPLTHAAAPLQTKTIIIQPLQTTVLPVIKHAPINIQPAPPPGQSSHCNTLPHTTLYCIRPVHWIYLRVVSCSLLKVFCNSFKFRDDISTVSCF